jgi:hypothetical protein
MNHAIADNEISPTTSTRSWLGDVVRSLVLDLDALSRPLARCELKVCHGTCCHDGVYLAGDEADAILNLVGEAGDEFRAMGLKLPDPCVVYGAESGIASGWKTATVTVSPDVQAIDYPKHFPMTRCVFLLADSRCALQVIAEQRNLPKWHYKPTTCWLHPLSLLTEGGRTPILTLHNERNDPQIRSGYPGFVPHTHCGRTCHGGQPAHLVLAEELEALGALGGRDLLAELAEPT